MSILAAIILTFNEELHIERCICSLQSVSEEIYVIDSFSTDRTVEIAKKLGAKVLQNPWKNHATQFNWGLENCKIQSDWILRMDADEYLSEELKNEIITELPAFPKEVTGLIMNYRHYFLGRWIKHGTRYPIPLLRIWRNGKGNIENKLMDERVVLYEGTTHKLKSDFIHDDLNDISFFINKHNGYASREAIDMLMKEFSLRDLNEEQNKNKQHFNLYLKNKFYSNSFLFVRSFVYFIYRYFFRFGFLDGIQGLIYHFLQGFWYRFLVDAKIYELKKRMNNDGETIKEWLMKEYGK